MTDSSAPIDAKEIESKPERYVRPLSAESSGTAPGRGRLNGRRVLVVGGGQRTFDAATDPIGFGRQRPRKRMRGASIASGSDWCANVLAI